MVYQDPVTTLYPSLRVGEQLAEVLTEHEGLKRREAHRRCVEMLNKVQMPDPEQVMVGVTQELTGTLGRGVRRDRVTHPIVLGERNFLAVPVDRGGRPENEPPDYDRRRIICLRPLPTPTLLTGSPMRSSIALT